jgi:hypothetical protein
MTEQEGKKEYPELTDAELRAAEAFLRAHDPGLAFPDGGFSEKRAKRTVWFMEHPLLATIYLHHRATALVCAILLVALLVAGLLAIKARLERPLPPVTILTSRPDGIPDLPPPDEAPEAPLSDPSAAPPSDLPGPDLDAPSPVELDAVEPL